MCGLRREMDMTLTQLAAGLPVHVMPGEGDPASAALPQQPLHRCAYMSRDSKQIAPGCLQARICCGQTTL